MKFFTLLFATIAVLVAGCVASPGLSKKETQAYLADKPKSLHSSFLPVTASPKNDRVSHQLAAGLAAMDAGENDLAAAAFDDALLVIETVYADNADAKNARGKFSKETEKVFRGEPYERAMAYYYRGVLYLMESDYENARASFKSGFLQDTLAGQEKYRGDFVLLEFLEGWASQCNGDTDLAADAYARARETSSGITLPGKNDNMLVLVDLGLAPVKYTAGKHNEYLKVKSQDRIATEETSGVTFWSTGGARKRLSNREDIAWQAKTRGGREFDTILANKAQFKETTAGAAEGTAVVANTFFNSALTTEDADLGEDFYNIGLATSVVSGAFSLFSAATKPQADIRSWRNLPEQVAYGTFASDGGGVPAIHLSGSTFTPPVHYTKGNRCSVAWARSRGAAL